MQETIKFLNGDIKARSYNNMVFTPNRMGDVVATMIHAEYKKQVHGCHIEMVCESDLHKRMKLDLLFKDSVDTWLPKNDGGVQNIYSPDPLWVSTPTLVKKFGVDIFPKISVNENMSRDYILFSPVFDCDYILDKNMTVDMVNYISSKLRKKHGKNFILVTNYPDKIDNISMYNTLPEDCLYDIISYVCNSSIFIGGCTGFTHFASIYGVPQIRQLTWKNVRFNFTYGNAWPGDFIHPFGVQGQYIGQLYTHDPMYNPNKTELIQWEMTNNLLSEKDIKDLLNSV